MPSFPEMVYYIQEKVWHLTLDDSLSYVMDDENKHTYFRWHV